MKYYEYKIIKSIGNFQVETLNHFGGKGWELVSVTIDPNNREVIAYLKKRTNL